MLPLSEEYLSCRCEMKTLDNAPVASGVLSKMSEDRFVITSPGDRLPVIHCKTTVKVNVYGSRSELRVLIGSVYLSTPKMLLLTDIKTVADYEKRSSYRIKVDIQTKACLLSGDPAEKVPVETFDAVIFNMSVCGAALKAPLKLKTGDRIIIYLTLYNTKFPLNGRIGRVITPYADGFGEYGCRFTEPSDRDIDLVSRYIFDCQREQIRLMKQSVR